MSWNEAQRLMDDLLVSLLGALCVNDSGEQSGAKKKNHHEGDRTGLN